MSKCWYCNEELTSATYCDEHIGICTKCYSSMFKVGNDFVKGLTDKIADLEAKLAEKETRIAELEDKDWYELTIKQLEEQCERLIIERDNAELKIAEKDEEIKNVTIRHLDMLKYFIRHNSKQGIILSSDLEREIKEIEQGEKIWQTKNFNQDKISFCIEQLEKVKELIKNMSVGIGIEIYGTRIKPVEEYIYNQIEELKKGVE